MKKLLLLCTILISLFASGPAYAGWPIGKYRNVVIPSFNYYRSADSWDRSGNVVKAAPGAGFTSYSAGLFVGYGLTRRLDLTANVVAPNQTSAYVNAQGDLIRSSNSGVGDLQIGATYNLVNFGFRSFLSVSASGIIPLYDSTSAVVLGYASYGSELKLMYSGGIDKGFLNHTYYNLEAGYRRYFAAQGPNVFLYTASLGIPLDKRNQIGFEIGGQLSRSSNKAFNPNLALNRDFSYTKASVDVGRTITRRFSVFLVGFYTFTGRNTGIGYGGSLQTIFKL